MRCQCSCGAGRDDNRANPIAKNSNVVGELGIRPFRRTRAGNNQVGARREPLSGLNSQQLANSTAEAVALDGVSHRARNCESHARWCRVRHFVTFRAKTDLEVAGSEPEAARADIGQCRPVPKGPDQAERRRRPLARRAFRTARPPLVAIR